MNNKGLKVFMWILHFVFVAGLAYGAYYYNGVIKNLKDSNSVLEEKLGLMMGTSTDANSNENSNASASSSCNETLTVAERDKITGWKSYSNATYKYSLKYPKTWTVTENSADNVTLAGTDSGERVSMQIKVGEKAIAGFAEYALESTKEVTMGCEKSTQTTYSADDSLVLIVNNFSHIGQKYLPMFSYKNLGASYSSDMVEINDLIVKTFTF